MTQLKRYLGYLLLLQVPSLHAEVVFDGTFGHSEHRSGDFLISEADGALSANGRNLFHSFETFNVSVGESATFTFDSAGVQTIIGRVTGTTASNIDGRITSDANLWIANPNGVLIGAGAVFDGAGVIQVQAADTVNFAGGDTFRVRDTQVSSLSIADPQSFGFVSARLDGALGGPALDVLVNETDSTVLTAAEGVQDGTNLFYSFDRFGVYPQQQLAFNVAGIDHVIVQADGGESAMLNGLVQIQSVTDTSLWVVNPNGLIAGANAVLDVSGTLGLGSASAFLFEDGSHALFGTTFAGAPVDLGATGMEGPLTLNALNYNGTEDVRIVGGQIVTVSHSNLATNNNSPDTGGTVSVHGTRVEISDSELSANTAAAGDAGEVRLTGSELIIDNSVLKSETQGAGGAGDLTLSATDILLRGTTLTAESPLATGGDAGDILILGNVRIENGQIVTRSASETGAAGVVNLTGDNIVLDSSIINTSSLAALTPTAAASIALRGNVSVQLLNNTEVAADTTRAAPAGNIEVSGPTVLIDASRVFAESFDGATGDAGSLLLKGTDISIVGDSNVASSALGQTANAGFVTLEATGTVSIAGGAKVSSSTRGAGAGGVIRVTADTFSITEDSSIATESLGDGAAGVVTIDTRVMNANRGLISTETRSQDADAVVAAVLVNASESVTLTDTFISASTRGAAAAGNVFFTTPEFAANNNTVVTSATIENATGNAGAVVVNATNVRLDSVARISSDSTSTGNGGLLDITASGTVHLSNQASVVSNTRNTGNGGNVVVRAGSLILDSGAKLQTIATTADGQPGQLGAAGSVFVTADTVALSGGAIIDTETRSLDAAATPGLVQVQATTSFDMSGASISADTLGAARAGDILITAPTIRIDSSTLFAESFVQGTGNAGNIRLDGDSVTLSGQSQVASRALTATPDAGTVTLEGTTVTIETGTEVSTSTAGAGIAGNIFITADRLEVLSGARVSSESSGSGDSGFLILDIGSTLYMNGGNLTTSSAISRGGDIRVATRNSEILLQDSLIAASAGAAGNGGNILLESDLLVLNRSGILAEAEAGNGGFINIDGKLLPDGSRSTVTVLQDFNSSISADSDSGNSGTVNVEAPSNDIAAVVSEQNADILEVPQLASSRCDTGSQQSRLTSTPDGTLQASPEAHLSLDLDAMASASTTENSGTRLLVACRESLLISGEGDE